MFFMENEKRKRKKKSLVIAWVCKTQGKINAIYFKKYLKTAVT